MSEKYDIHKGLSYFCDHHTHQSNDYIDLGFVLWPSENGHFGIIRYGTEVLIFDLNDFMNTKKIEEKDVLWYEEFVMLDQAYTKVLALYTELEMALQGVKDPTIRFPHIDGKLSSCEILQTQPILNMMHSCFKSYGEGFLEGNMEAYKYLFTKEH